jgi:hypothetical protein
VNSASPTEETVVNTIMRPIRNQHALDEVDGRNGGYHGTARRIDVTLVVEAGALVDYVGV